MEYLTAVETAKKWNVSSRMVAKYCEEGRIEGAVKKGKVWLVPASADKPFDRRISKKNVLVTELNENSISDADDLSEIYHVKDVYENLGLSRETLRYYEEIGLISTKRNSESQYREFDFLDISHLMAIDFYKKRGFTPLEIKKLMNVEDDEEYSLMLQNHIQSMENELKNLSEMLERLRITKQFFDNVDKTDIRFSIRNLRLYLVREMLDSVTSFGEYRDKVLGYLNLKNEDILSNMVRMVTFDNTGYKGSGMCIVKPADSKAGRDKSIYLESGRSLYTTIVPDNDDNSIMEKMFELVSVWSKTNQIELKGVAYIFISFIKFNECTEKHYYEVWIPLK